MTQYLPKGKFDILLQKSIGKTSLPCVYNLFMHNTDETHKPVEITTLYENLEIHPNLQEHMVWVAGLTKVISDNWKGEKPLDSTALYEACLFHDSAKLIKFKTFETDASHWEEVRQRYIAKYGNTEHEATIAICEEAGVSPKAIQLLNEKNINPFVERARYIATCDNFELKVLAYCDSRISPKGIASLQDRYQELLSRDDTKSDDKESIELFLQIEKQIQENTGINLAEITQQQVDSTKGYFLTYKI